MTTPNGKSRPLTVVVPIEKIMKRAMRAVPESIYDPEFLDTSHFRPGRGCHSALIRIRKEWGYSNWFLEFGISKCFHTIDRHRLIPILKEEIDGGAGKNSLFFRPIHKRGPLSNLSIVGAGPLLSVGQRESTRPPTPTPTPILRGGGPLPLYCGRGGRGGGPLSALSIVSRPVGRGDRGPSTDRERGMGRRPSSVLLSALLGNIYLHKLDQEIERIQQKHEIPIVQITKLVPSDHPDDRYALNRRKALDRELNRRREALAFLQAKIEGVSDSEPLVRPSPPYPNLGAWEEGPKDLDRQGERFATLTPRPIALSIEGVPPPTPPFYSPFYSGGVDSCPRPVGRVLSRWPIDIRGPSIRRGGAFLSIGVPRSIALSIAILERWGVPPTMDRVNSGRKGPRFLQKSGSRLFNYAPFTHYNPPIVPTQPGNSPTILKGEALYLPPNSHPYWSVECPIGGPRLRNQSSGSLSLTPLPIALGGPPPGVGGRRGRLDLDGSDSCPRSPRPNQTQPTPPTLTLPPTPILRGGGGGPLPLYCIGGGGGREPPQYPPPTRARDGPPPQYGGRVAMDSLDSWVGGLNSCGGGPYYSMDSGGPEGIRIRYARYADDFSLGIVGTVELLRGIQKRITHFLQSGLNGSSSGFTTIAARSTVEFPGTVIREGATLYSRHSTAQRPNSNSWRELEKRRRAKHRIHLTASHLRSAIHSKLEDLGRSIPIQRLCRRSEQLTRLLDQRRVGHRSTSGPVVGPLPPRPIALSIEGVSPPTIDRLDMDSSDSWVGGLNSCGGGPYYSMVAIERALLYKGRPNPRGGRERPPHPPYYSYSLDSSIGRVLSRWPIDSRGPIGRSHSRSAGSGSELTAGKSAHQESSKTQIKAPVRKILQRLRDRGIISRRRAWPTHVACLTNVGDEDIVNRFAGVAISPLSHYRCRDNFYQVRTIVDYQIRWSAIFTPAHKRKSSARKIILEYSRDLHIVNGGKTLAESPNSIELRKLGPLTSEDLDYLDTEHAYKTSYQVYIRYA
nr:maturase-related protein [Platycladus orientalis]